ncbi:hypothetical protein [Streptomyces sp. DH8]|uniref:hypothetical protein n=1 Tax=Streptomyces sp. DH8 TaxID=2857008 RepID=UPI001E3E6DB9|nr:hypothetical protein [Streptomyces sp. DH8]
MKRRRTVRESVPTEPPSGHRTAGGEPPQAARGAWVLDRTVSRGIVGSRQPGARPGSRVALVRGRPVDPAPPVPLTVFPCLARGLVRPVVAVASRVEREAPTVDAHGRVVTVSAP